MKQFISLLLFFISLISISAQEVDSIIDIRDGQQYKIVKIGQQWWMQENLNIGTRINTIQNASDNDVIEKYFYQNNDSLGNIYGGLYQWDEMMDYQASDNENPGITQGICPIGWHIPTDDEWGELEMHLGMRQSEVDSGVWRGINVGSKLKEIGTVHWIPSNTDANNSSGFTALPGGSYHFNGSFYAVGEGAYFWSSTEHVDHYPLGRILSYDHSEIGLSTYDKSMGFSVRCLRDSCQFNYLNIMDKKLNSISNLVLNNDQASETFIIFNSGAGTTINISSIINSNSAFHLNKSSSVLSPGDSIHMSITFNPPGKGIYLDTLFIESDDPYKPIIKIPIEGVFFTEAPCGVITENTTWTKDNSPYYLGCNLAIDQGVTLTIEPGVTVMIDSMIRFIADGTISARGSIDDSISFTSSGEYKFNMIEFRQGSIGELSYFTVENANIGISTSAESLELSYGSIQKCNIGIGFTEDTLIAEHITFSNTNIAFEAYEKMNDQTRLFLQLNKNNFNLNTNGVVINFAQNADINLMENNFSDNTIAISISPGVFTKSIIRDNQIVNNSSCGIHLKNSSDYADDTQVINNYIAKNEMGIQIEYFNANLIIEANQIQYNSDGIHKKGIVGNTLITRNIIAYNTRDGIFDDPLSGTDYNYEISYNTIINNGEDGIQSSSSRHIINFNNIHSNSGYNLNAINKSLETINAENNYWGFAIKSEIAETIYDYYDDGLSVKVDFEPFLLEAASNTNIDFAQNVSACQGGPITNLRATGDSINWYSSPDFTGLLHSGNTFETGQTDPGIYVYYVTQTFEDNTAFKDTAALTISSNPMIINIEKSNEAGCTSADGSITINASDTYLLTYSIDGGNTYFANVGLFTSLDNGNYPVVVKNDMGCSTSGSSVQIISEGDIPTNPLTSDDMIYCPDDQMVNITAQASSGGTISWYDDPGLKNLKGTGVSYNPTGISSATTFYATETVGDCESPSSEVKIEIRNTIPFEDEKICMVSVDLNTGYNMIIWEKTPDVGTQYFNVYREGTLIGTTEFHELSILKDTTVDPETRPYLYFLTTVDSCGNESALSPYHKPLFLQFVSSQDGVNLRWSNYAIEGESLTFDSYSIYRGSDLLSLAPFAEYIPTAVDVYTDNDPTALTNKYYYRVAGVLKDPCYPSGEKKAGTGPYYHSLSNMDDNKLRDTGDTTDTYIYPLTSQTLLIYPNPINNKATIQFSNPEGRKYHLQIFDGMGRVVFQKFNITEDQIEFQRGDLPNGLYLVELRGPKVFRGRLILD